MNVLIAGGAGFLGRALTKSLIADGHKVWVLTRNPRKVRLPEGAQAVLWNGRSTDGWGEVVNDMGAVVNLTGHGLDHWPWTKRQKQRFHDSRVFPGRALVSAIQNASRRPRVFVQISGINRYGLRGEGIATEETPPASDYLAQLTVAWEAATQPVEDLGVRRVVARQAVVLDSRGGLLPLMALPVKLFVGGPLGSGKQALPWIHLADQVGTIRFLLENEKARGPFNLIAPTPTSNAEFMQALAKSLHRPYWFPTPAFLLQLTLGEMSVLITEGRFSQPKRLLEMGYNFKFPRVEEAFRDLFG